MGEIRDYFYAHLYQLKELLAINSIYDGETACAEMPYGKGPSAALDYMRQLALSDGFEVLEYDNQAIAIRRKGEEHAERIDIASHLDVVEVDGNWTRDPFKPEIIDGRLYGRGSCDMKTAAFESYLVLKKLTEENVPFQKELRIVYGCDEERTMNDMFHYVAKAGLPAFAYTPDGRFPMAIGEKGALMWRIKGQYKGSIIRKLEAGVQCNVISPKASVELAEDFDVELLKEKLAGIGKYELDGKRLTVYGRAAHCSMPPAGHSATVDLLYVLKDFDSLAANLYEIFKSPYGDTFGYQPLEILKDVLPEDLSASGDMEAAASKLFALYLSDQQQSAKIQGAFQKLFTNNLGVIRIAENGEIYAEVDGRYPYPLSSVELTKKLQKMCDYTVTLDYDSPPTMNSLDDPYIRILLDVYREKTGDHTEPFVSGGVSYSKVFGHCVTYGLDAGNSTSSMAHQADEYVEIEDAIKALEIYYEAVKRLVSARELT